MKGAHLQFQLQGNVQLSSAMRGEERKAKCTYSPYNITIKQDYLNSHAKKIKCSLFKKLPFLLKLFFTSCSFTKPLNLQNLCLSLLPVTVIHFDPMSPSFLLLPSSSLRPPQSCSMGRQKSQPFLSSSPSRALSLIPLVLCNLQSLCLSLARSPWLFLHGQGSPFHLPPLHSPFQSGSESPVPRTSSSPNPAQPRPCEP